jgi:hypothetical protein
MPAGLAELAANSAVRRFGTNSAALEELDDLGVGSRGSFAASRDAAW